VEFDEDGSEIVYEYALRNLLSLPLTKKLSSEASL